MSISVLTSNLDYVKYLLDIEKKGGAIKSVLSFLSSIYFPSSAIERFFRDHAQGDQITKALLERSAIARASNECRYEIYESTAFTDIIRQGIVHRQERNYRSLLKDLASVFDIIIRMMDSGLLTIGITSEVVPYIYTISPSRDILIDVKANYSYQRVQGLFLQDEGFEAFADDFKGLWDSPRTLTDQLRVKGLIQRALDQRANGKPIDLRQWPTMKESDYVDE